MTGGTRVLSDWIKVIEIRQSIPARWVHRSDDRSGRRVVERQKTPNEIALTILLAGLTIVFLIAVRTVALASDRALCFGGERAGSRSLVALLDHA